MIIGVTLTLCVNLQSQNLNQVPVLRERIAQAQLLEIRRNLRLDQATFVRFRPIYLRYERELARIDFAKQARLMKIDVDSLSNEEADGLMVSQLQSSRMLVMIHERYYKEFRKVLSPQQTIKLYQTEAELRNKVVQETKKRMMNRGF